MSRPSLTKSRTTAAAVYPFSAGERRRLDALVQHSADPVLTEMSRRARTEGIAELERFLSLKIANKDWDAALFSPSPLVDHLWHCLVLDTRTYHAYCQRHAGCLVHHDPEGAHDGKREARYTNTYAALPAASKALDEWWPAPPAAAATLSFTVRLGSEPDVRVTLPRTATLGDLKTFNERQFGTLAAGQTMSCSARPGLLQGSDNQRLVDLGVADDSALLLGYVGVVVKVLLPTGHLVDVRLISYPALLAELFAKVLDEVDVPCNEQLFVQGDRRVDFRRRLDRITAHFELDQHIVLCISKHAPTPADHERVTVHFASLTGERFSGTFVLGQATVADARMWIRRHTGIPEDSQRLIFRGRQLCNPERSLADEGVLPGSKIHITLCLSGC